MTKSNFPKPIDILIKICYNIYNKERKRYHPMTAKEKLIYNYIKEHPGCRHREIREIPLVERIVLLDDLTNKGLIRKQLFSDFANREYYDKWYVVE